MILCIITWAKWEKSSQSLQKLRVNSWTPLSCDPLRSPEARFMWGSQASVAPQDISKVTFRQNACYLIICLNGLNAALLNLYWFYSWAFKISPARFQIFMDACFGCYLYLFGSQLGHRLPAWSFVFSSHRVTMYLSNNRIYQISQLCQQQSPGLAIKKSLFLWVQQEVKNET